jgi:outer membrane protein TolC
MKRFTLLGKVRGIRRLAFLGFSLGMGSGLAAQPPSLPTSFAGSPVPATPTMPSPAYASEVGRPTTLPQAAPAFTVPVSAAPPVSLDDALPPALPMPRKDPAANRDRTEPPNPLDPRAHVASGTTERMLPIDLPYALHLVGTANPTIALAEQRIAEAYAMLKQAQVLWVPNLWLGGNPNAPTFLPTFYHHNGLLQTSSGTVEFTDKNYFFLGAGSSLVVSLADALFAPHIAGFGVAAAQAHARAVTNDIQLQVALAYLDLLRQYGALAINDEALRKAQEMDRAAESAFKRGLGKTGADPNRARAEVEVRRQERLVLQEQAAVASARLAQLLLLDASADLLPGDQTVVPITLVSCEGAIDELIAVGLMNRPELAEFRALISAALVRWNEAKFRPLIPTLQAFYYGGSFIGGQPALNTAGGREDVIVQMCWEVKSLGLGNLFEARERRAQYNQANLRLVEEQAQVAAEVTVAAKIARQRLRAVEEAQVAVRNAEETWRKLRAIAFGVGLPARQYDPLEALIAERQLLEARTLYLDHVIEYNRSQFRLYWAMGQPPEHSLPGASVRPTTVPVLPGASQLEPKKERDTKKERDEKRPARD